MIIGLVGEDPNDTSSMKNLLKKKYSEERFSYVTMLNNINGSLLDSQKTKRLLRIECETMVPDIIIFIRDLDGLVNTRKNPTFIKRKEYFSGNNSVVDKRGIFLLHVYEIEALILADIGAFNKYFNSSIEFSENPMKIAEPKEFLKLNCKGYSEGQNPQIFEHMNFETVLSRCQYFQGFIRLFERKLKNEV